MDRRTEVIRVLKYILSFSLSMESMEGDFCDLEWKSSLVVFCLAIKDKRLGSLFFTSSLLKRIAYATFNIAVNPYYAVITPIENNWLLQ